MLSGDYLGYIIGGAICAYLGIWVPYYFLMCEEIKRKRLWAFRSREKVLHELCYSGAAYAEEVSKKSQKADGFRWTPEEKLQEAIEFVLSKDLDFTPEEIRADVESILGKVPNAGASGRIKL